MGKEPSSIHAVEEMEEGSEIPKNDGKVWIKMNKWQSVTRKEVRFVMNLA
jgi:hypothetical protein